MRVTQITALVNGLVQYKETSKRNIMGASKYKAVQSAVSSL